MRLQTRLQKLSTIILEIRAGNVGPGWDLAAEGKAKNKIKQRDLPLLPQWSILVGVY